MDTELTFGEWEEVRIVKPCSPQQIWLGRLPQVGECGVIVHINEDAQTRAPGTIYVVENVVFQDACHAEMV